MNLIIPMAGIGKRLRPHTLTIPKPLLPIAGKPIVQRLVEDIAAMCHESIDEIAFVTGSFGEEVEAKLLTVAHNAGAKGAIYYQPEALGTAHAILCAENSLRGKIIVAFADTLFRTEFTLDETQDGTIWVKKIDNPGAFGVVTVNVNKVITGFVEKPDQFVSDLAIIGIYYFNNGMRLKEELQYIIGNNILEKGEYQLTSALDNMMKKGTKFIAGAVSEWLDCGNKNSTVNTNKRILELNSGNGMISGSSINICSKIIAPCYIGENVRLVNSEIGPFVSVGESTLIEDSKITNSIILSGSILRSVNLRNSMIGNCVEYSDQGMKSKTKEVSIGDYSVIG